MTEVQVFDGDGSCWYDDEHLKFRAAISIGNIHSGIVRLLPDRKLSIEVPSTDLLCVELDNLIGNGPFSMLIDTNSNSTRDYHGGHSGCRILERRHTKINKLSGVLFLISYERVDHG